MDEQVRRHRSSGSSHRSSTHSSSHLSSSHSTSNLFSTHSSSAARKFSTKARRYQTRPKRYSLDVILLARLRCSHCRHGQLSAFELLGDDILYTIARFATRAEVNALLATSHNIALVLVSRHVPRENALRDVMEHARVTCTEENMSFLLRTAVRWMPVEPEVAEAKDAYRLSNRIRSLTEIKSIKPTDISEYIGQLFYGNLKYKTTSSRVRHEKFARMQGLTSVAGEIFKGNVVGQGTLSHRQTLTMRSLDNALSGNPFAMEFAKQIMKDPVFEGKSLPLLLVAAEHGDNDTIALIAHEVRRDAAEGVFTNDTRFRDFVLEALRDALNKASRNGSVSSVRELNALYQELEPGSMANLTRACIINGFRNRQWTFAWTLLDDVPDRTFTLLLAVFFYSFVVRLCADAHYFNWILLVNHPTGPQFPRTVVTILIAMFTSLLSVFIKNLVGYPVLLLLLSISASVTYLLEYGMTTHVPRLAEYPTLRPLSNFISLLETSPERSKMLASSQVATCTLFGITLFAHTNENHLKWLFSSPFFSFQTLLSSFYRSFNAGFSYAFYLGFFLFRGTAITELVNMAIHEMNNNIEPGDFQLDPDMVRNNLWLFGVAMVLFWEHFFPVYWIIKLMSNSTIFVRLIVTILLS